MSEPCATQGTPMMSTHTTGNTGRWWNAGNLLKDWRGQMSWGRVCSVVALVVAVRGQFQPTPMDTAHLIIWLGVATGTYMGSKITEMITAKRVTETGGDQ